MRPHKLHGIMVASFALALGLAGCASAGGAGQSGGSANELMAEDFTPDMQVLTCTKRFSGCAQPGSAVAVARVRESTWMASCAVDLRSSKHCEWIKSQERNA